MNVKEFVLSRAKEAQKSARTLATATSDQKNRVLLSMAQAVRDSASCLIEENKKDIEYANSKGLSDALIDRLALTQKRIDEMAQGLIEVAQLPDPVGEVTRMWQRPNGLMVGKMRVPIGVIGIIYESRPNVTADASSLCLKAGNAVLLRGGSEALHSNRAIVDILRDGIRAAGLPEGIIAFLDTSDRDAVMEMLKLEGIIDLIIPRGGEGLIRAVTENSRIPVLKHFKGVCHIFVDRGADLRMAEEICFNAKVQRPGTCNAMETMLVDREIAASFVPSVLKRFMNADVKIKGCEETKSYVSGVEPVSDIDFHTEYNDLILNVKIVADMEEAMAHIAQYSSAHSEAIITKDYARSIRFLREVDSSAVFVNASTRFNDGFQFGLGAEIGISTDKIHARGPMGIEELTCTKFIVFGNGQVRE